MTPSAAASSTTRSHSSVVSSSCPRTSARGFEQYGQARAHRCVSSATSVYGAPSGVASDRAPDVASSRGSPAGRGSRALFPFASLPSSASSKPRPRRSASSLRTSPSIRARGAGAAEYRAASSPTMASTSRSPSQRPTTAAAVALRRRPRSGERSTGVPSRGSGRTRTPRESRGFTVSTRRRRPACPRELCTFR